MAEAPGIEAVGMASSLLEPGVVLLTGGCGRRGRNTAAMLLIREHTVWRCATVKPEGEKGMCVRARVSDLCFTYIFKTNSLLLQVIDLLFI